MGRDEIHLASLCIFREPFVFICLVSSRRVTLSFSLRIPQCPVPSRAVLHARTIAVLRRDGASAPARRLEHEC